MLGLISACECSFHMCGLTGCIQMYTYVSMGSPKLMSAVFRHNFSFYVFVEVGSPIEPELDGFDWTG